MDAEKQIQEAVRKAHKEQVVVMVMSVEAARALFGGSALDDPRYVPDLTLQETGEMLNPKSPLKEKTVAELCREGYFPDTPQPDGSVIAGAYPERGSWRITREGLIAAQEKSRRAPSPGRVRRPADDPPTTVLVQRGDGTDQNQRDAASAQDAASEDGVHRSPDGNSDRGDGADFEKSERPDIQDAADASPDETEPTPRHSQAEVRRRQTPAWKRTR